MLEKSFLATWCALFAVLFLLASAGLSLWSTTLRDEENAVNAVNQAMTMTLAAVCAVGGAAIGMLGRAFSQIDKLERRGKLSPTTVATCRRP